MTALDEWWEQLSADTRLLLVADPYGPVPADVVTEVSRAGHLFAGDDWPDVQPGTGDYFLPPAAQEYVAAKVEPQ